MWRSQEPGPIEAGQPLGDDPSARPPAIYALAAGALAYLLTGCTALSERPAGYGVGHAPPPLANEAPVVPPMPTFQVAHAQVLLTDLGYRPGPANGVVDSATEAAVRAFQETEGLSVDGRMSDALVAQLEVADRALSVRRVQVRLLALGYDPGAIDGTLGAHTRAAISVYEQDRDLPVSGDVTALLLQSLRDEQPTPLPRARLRQPPGGAASGAVAANATLSLEDARSLAAVATAAGGAPSGAPSGSSPAPELIDLEAAASETGWESSGEGEQMALAPEIPQSLPPDTADSDGPAAPPVIGLAALPEEARQAGPPLAPGDRIRLALGSDGADVIEREIGADGQLALPGGLTVAAAGLTLPELKRAITVKLLESYLESLNVEISRPEESTAGQQNAQ